jgi:glycerophosphoryl diester phosphodiesterase
MPEHTAERAGKPVTLIHHAANNGHTAPPGSLSALEQCLEACAAVVEIDLIPLADGSFALLHEQDLAVETDGTGKAPHMRREQVKDLRYRLNGGITNERVGFLEGAVELLAAYPQTQRLQLDLKPFAPFSGSLLTHFLALIEPVKSRVQVTSVGDWALRALATADPGLSLGFDPLLYLDLVEEEPRSEGVPPFRVGAYGLLDDHPLSAYAWGSLGDYFAARASALLAQAVPGCDWFIRAEVLKMALEAGFDWINFLHQQGSAVDAWTIDVEQPDQVELARYLVEHGVDALTTDSPSRLAQQISTATLV